MLSTTEIAGVILLVLLLVVVIWWFAVADRYKRYLKNYSYVRGANAYKLGETLNLTCGKNKKICVSSATQICTHPNSQNFENVNTDPIDSGNSSNRYYGDFDPETTVSLLEDMKKVCDGHGKCEYKFTGKSFPNGMTCGGNTQLISTYTCVPEDSNC